MARLAVTVRDLDNPEIPVLATSDDAVVEAVTRIIGARLRGEALRVGPERVIDMAPARRPDPTDSDEK
jgi:hypothetical protein